MVSETCEISGDNPEEAEKPASPEEPDLKPELCHYKDEGCEYAPSCLECPFPRCLHDEPGGKQRWLKELRNREINQLFNTGWKARELGMLFGVSQRTVRRVLKGSEGISN